MPPRWRCSLHQSANVSSMCQRAKRPPEDTRWRPSRGAAPCRKTSPVAQRTGGHQRVVTRKATGDLTSRREQAIPQTADGGIRTERARRGHLSRRSLRFSTTQRAGELSEWRLGLRLIWKVARDSEVRQDGRLPTCFSPHAVGPICRTGQ